jgi:hypothetical protein
MRLSIRRVYAVSAIEMPTLLVAAQPGDLIEALINGIRSDGSRSELPRERDSLNERKTFAQTFAQLS